MLLALTLFTVSFCPTVLSFGSVLNGIGSSDHFNPYELIESGYDTTFCIGIIRADECNIEVGTVSCVGRVV